MSELTAGTQISLNDAGVYPTPRSPKAACTKSGTFYIWGDKVSNDKIKITSKESFVGVYGCATGWVNVSDINNVEEATSKTTTTKYNFTAGQAVELKDVNFYSNSSIDKVVATKSGTYYIWSSDITNDRIRITNDPTKAGKSGYITAWVKVDEI
jgi:hypothetical protein